MDIWGFDDDIDVEHIKKIKEAFDRNAKILNETNDIKTGKITYDEYLEQIRQGFKELKYLLEGLSESGVSISTKSANKRIKGK